MEANMNILEGAQYRLRVKLTNEAGAQLPPENFRVYGGAFCPGFAPAHFHAERTAEEWVLTMPGLKPGRVPWNWQVIAAEYATGVEWLLAGGEVTVTPRHATGSAAVDPGELNVLATLDKTTLKMTVQLGESTAECGRAVVAARNSAAAAAGSAEEAGEHRAGAEAAQRAADVAAADAAADAVTAQQQAGEAAGSAAQAAASAAGANADAELAGEHATEAAARASAAAASATDAATSSKAAADSASEAIEAAEHATQQAASAAGSATAAGASATAAEDSATAAGASETAAAASATAAGASATAAAEDAAKLGDAALKGANNSFSGTNTFNGAIVANDGITGLPALGTGSNAVCANAMGLLSLVETGLTRRIPLTWGTPVGNMTVTGGEVLTSSQDKIGYVRAAAVSPYGVQSTNVGLYGDFFMPLKFTTGMNDSHGRVDILFTKGGWGYNGEATGWPIDLATLKNEQGSACISIEVHRDSRWMAARVVLRAVGYSTPDVASGLTVTEREYSLQGTNFNPLFVGNCTGLLGVLLARDNADKNKVVVLLFFGWPTKTQVYKLATIPWASTVQGLHTLRLQVACYNTAGVYLPCMFYRERCGVSDVYVDAATALGAKDLATVGTTIADISCPLADYLATE